MTNLTFDQQETELRAFDPAFYSKLYRVSPLLAYMVANVVNIQLETRVLCESEDIWRELRTHSNSEVARKIGIPIQLLHKIPSSALASPTITDDLAMLRRVLLTKPKCGRYLRHASHISLNTARAMYMVDCDDSKLWNWFSELPSSTAGYVTDTLVVISNILERTGRRWQAGMVRDEATLARTYERMLAVRLPEPPFADDPHAIIACRTGAEISEWGLLQRNCAASYISTCITGNKIIYKMISPSPATLLIALEIDRKPQLIDARSHANGEMSMAQLNVMCDWCDKNGINYNRWLTEGAR